MRPGPTRTLTASAAGRAGAADHEDESRKHAVDLEAERPRPGDSPYADPEVEAEIYRSGGRDPGRKIVTEEALDGGCPVVAETWFDYLQEGDSDDSL